MNLPIYIDNLNQLQKLTKQQNFQPHFDKNTEHLDRVKWKKKTEPEVETDTVKKCVCVCVLVCCDRN
jgi:hypothetical protein